MSHSREEKKPDVQLSTLPFTLHGKTPKKDKKKFLEFLEAIVFNLDDNLDPDIFNHSSNIFSILESNPEFFFEKPKNYGITKIVCPFTQRVFLPGDETAFSMAQKLGHTSVLFDMWRYYRKQLKDAQERNDQPAISITEMKNAWIMRARNKEEQEALREKYKTELILPVINALKVDTDINVEWKIDPTKKYKKESWVLVPEYKNVNGMLFYREAQDGEYKYEEATIKNAKDTTLAALKKLQDELFKPTRVDECIDVYQFLLALYEFNRFDTFPKSEQRDAYAICVVGLGQSLSDCFLGRSFCKSIYNEYYGEPVVCSSVWSKVFKLQDGRSFYRERPDDLSGAGVSFVCSYTGRAEGDWRFNLCGGNVVPAFIERHSNSKATMCDYWTRELQKIVENENVKQAAVRPN